MYSCKILCLLLFFIVYAEDVTEQRCPQTDSCMPSLPGYNCSYQFCPDYSSGSYKLICLQSGIWSPLTIEMCKLNSPSNFYYGKDNNNILTIYSNFEVSLQPSIVCSQCSFSLDENSLLPPGLSLLDNGIIQGLVTSPFSDFSFKIKAYNSMGEVSCNITLSAVEMRIDNSLLPTTHSSLVDLFFIKFMSFQPVITIILSILLFVSIVFYLFLKQEKRNLPIKLTKIAK